MYERIKNPMTNRYVAINSKLGKTILNNYINQLGGGVCGVNPDTGRCGKKFLHNNPELCEINPDTGRCVKVMTKATQRPKPPITIKPQNLVAVPKKPSKPLSKKIIKEVTTFSKGTTDRLSAGEYLRSGGKEGDICDIRSDGELRCLVIGKNGTPSWKKITKNQETLTYKTCGSGPWKKKCAVKLQKL
jgi:hypothetical protein